MNAAPGNAKKERRSKVGQLFANQMVRSAALRPGECLEIRFEVRQPATVTLLGAERYPSVGALLDQNYALELVEAAQSVPLARKESLRGVVVTTLTQTIDQTGEPRSWIARLCNTGAQARGLSLVVAIA